MTGREPQVKTSNALLVIEPLVLIGAVLVSNPLSCAGRALSSLTEQYRYTALRSVSCRVTVISLN